MNQSQRQMAGTDAGSSRFDAIVVGAGFAGLYMLHRLRGMGLAVKVLEAGGDVGGTWYWNRYPGARCDVESMQYSYQFSPELQQDWEWSEKYATQPEILRYANHVADRFDLRRDSRFDTRVTRAAYDEATSTWILHTDGGAVYIAPFCILATGCLSATNTPRLPGLGDFRGRVFHTGRWPHEAVDFTGRRVGVIGTGSSAIQSIPIIAEQAAHLTVFQRTPNFSVPARNAPWDPAARARVKADYAGLRATARQTFSGIAFRYNPQSAMAVAPEERAKEYEARWAHGGVSFMGAFADLLFDPAANETAAEFVRDRIRALVHDPAVAEVLSPRDIIGCKRLCVDTGYYETFNRSNVTLVDVRRDPIECITAGGLRVTGRDHGFDDLVLATGFDAMTGALDRIDIRGRHGLALKEKWGAGPRSYLGLAVAGFPNLFTITGPGSPSVLTNMLPSIEQHVDWIAGCIGHLRARRLTCIEAQADAEAAWVEHANVVASGNLRSSCSSWYVGANVPGKPRVFMPYIGGFPAYVAKCEEVVARCYEGFVLA